MTITYQKNFYSENLAKDQNFCTDKSTMSVHKSSYYFNRPNLGIAGRHLQTVGAALGLELTSKLNLIVPVATNQN